MRMRTPYSERCANRRPHRRWRSGVYQDDGGRDFDPPVRDVLRRERRRRAPAAAAETRTGSGGRRVPGDLPAGAPSLRPAAARRAPPRLGPDDRRARGDRRASTRGRADRRASGAPASRRSSRVRRARLPDRHAPGEGACGRGPALRLRPRLRADRHRPRLERRRCASGRVVGRPAPAKEDNVTVPADLDRRFRDAAARTGLLDASYDVIDSELGPLLAAVTDRGLARISFDPDPDRELDALARLAGPRVLRAPRALDETRRELDDYFAGKRTVFDLDLDLRGLSGFTLRVLDELARVPYGQTATYGELADRAGNPRASRAVGMVMNRNRIPIVLPCHRIVGSSGQLVGYGGGLERKETLLRLEGAIL